MIIRESGKSGNLDYKIKKRAQVSKILRFDNVFKI
jgi:hypothetical protein